MPMEFGAQFRANNGMAVFDLGQTPIPPNSPFFAKLSTASRSSSLAFCMAISSKRTLPANKFAKRNFSRRANLGAARNAATAAKSSQEENSLEFYSKTFSRTYRRLKRG
jgi:hypothetical protein